jgi:hypothetical protein
MNQPTPLQTAELTQITGGTWQDEAQEASNHAAQRYFAQCMDTLDK